MPLNATTPIHRVTRMLREGARLIAVQQGQTSIDVTPDIIAMLDGVQTQRDVTCDGLTCLPEHESSHKPG